MRYVVKRNDECHRVETNPDDVVVYDGTRTVLHTQINRALKKLRSDGWKVSPIEDEAVSSKEQR